MRILSFAGLRERAGCAELAAAASAHSDAAFDGCGLVIDRLKSEAALWKREEGPGGACWLSPREGDEKASAALARVER